MLLLFTPSNNLNVIIGQGTAALELLQKFPDIKNIVSPVGGGGLIAGTALAAQFVNNGIHVFGGEPSGMDDACRSLQSGKIENNEPGANTIADGLKTNLGDINFPIIQKCVKEIVLVEEQEIINALKLLWERRKILVEPSSAVALTALLKRTALFACYFPLSFKIKVIYPKLI